MKSAGGIKFGNRENTKDTNILAIGRIAQLVRNGIVRKEG